LAGPPALPGEPLLSDAPLLPLDMPLPGVPLVLPPYGSLALLPEAPLPEVPAPLLPDDSLLLPDIPEDFFFLLVVPVSDADEPDEPEEPVALTGASPPPSPEPCANATPVLPNAEMSAAIKSFFIEYLHGWTGSTLEWCRRFLSGTPERALEGVRDLPTLKFIRHLYQNVTFRVEKARGARHASATVFIANEDDVNDDAVNISNGFGAGHLGLVFSFQCADMPD
jgi:hypothetical protein